MTRLRPPRRVRHADNEEQVRREAEALRRIERKLQRRQETKDASTGDN